MNIVDTDLEGFVFTVTTTDGRQLDVRLQGHGGERGAGCLSRANALRGEAERGPYLERVCAELLARTRAEAEETGHVRPLAPAEPIPVKSIVAVCGVFAAMPPHRGFGGRP